MNYLFNKLFPLFFVFAMAQEGLARTPLNQAQRSIASELTDSLFDGVENVEVTQEEDEVVIEEPIEEPVPRATVLENTVTERMPVVRRQTITRFTKKGQDQNSDSCFAGYDAQECEAVALTNAHRKRHGLSPLGIAQNCSSLAESHATDMVQNGFFSHNSPYNGSFAQRAQKFGLRGGGENIAAGYNSAQRVIDGWIASPGHNQNMLEPEFTKIGIARVGNHWVQCFTR